MNNASPSDLPADARQLLGILCALARELRPSAEGIERLGMEHALERDFGLDSLARVELLARIERELGVRLAESAFAEAETPRDLLRLMTGAASPEQVVPVRAVEGEARGIETPSAEIATLTGLLDWHVAQHGERIHITLYGEDERGEDISYRRLQAMAHALAAGLLAMGMRTGERVAIMLPTGRNFFAAFYGALHAGCVPVPLYPPARLAQLEDHMQRIAGIVANAEAALFITDTRAKPLGHLLHAQCASLRGVVTVAELSPPTPLTASPPTLPAATVQDIAFLQYTDPAQVEFVQYLRHPGDVSPEGLTFVDAAHSPNGEDLLFVTNEVSNTVTVFHRDTTAPTLVSASPADEAVGVTSHHIILTFNEAVMAGSGDIVISGSNGSNGSQTDTRTIAVGDVTQVTISGNTVDINPGADLLNGYTYNVQFASGVIQDLAGNAYAGLTTPDALNFTRAVPGVSTLMITELNSNADGGDFFELYNYGATPIDLTGWKWDDNSASFTDAAVASFASGTIIAAGGRLIVAADTTDTAALKTAWGLGNDVPVVAVGGPGLGSGDAVVVFNAAGNVVTSFNYGNALTASDSSAIPVSSAAPGVTFTSGHAGSAFGGSQQTSAVWDGVSTSAPAYQAAQLGVNGAFAQPAISTTVGSPGIVTGSSVPDTTAPQLSSAQPADGAIDVAITNNIVLTFNEAVKAGSGNFVLTNAADAGDTRTLAVGDASQVSFSGATVTLNPSADLNFGATYTLTFAAGVVEDLAGNDHAGVFSTTELNFTTGAAPLPSVLISEVNSNAGPADFFEIYNYGATTVDLSGWKWDDDSASFNDAAAASFASGTTLAAGGRLVVVQAADAAAFKTAWGLGNDVQVIATGGPGLGQNDAVVLFNQSGTVVASFNYTGTTKTASDGSTINVSAAAPGVTQTTGHAGAVFGGTATTSAVWDGESTSAPAYQAAAVGVDGGFAQTATATNIGSPGAVFGPITAPTLSFTAPGTSFDLANYTLVDLGQHGPGGDELPLVIREKGCASDMVAVALIQPRHQGAGVHQRLSHDDLSQPVSRASVGNDCGPGPQLHYRCSRSARALPPAWPATRLELPTRRCQPSRRRSGFARYGRRRRAGGHRSDHRGGQIGCAWVCPRV